MARKISEAIENIAQSAVEAVRAEKDSIWKKAGRFAIYALVAVAPLAYFPILGSAIEVSKTAIMSALLFVALVCALLETISSRKIIWAKSVAIFAPLFLLLATVVSGIFSVSGVSWFGGMFQPDSVFMVFLFFWAFYLSYYFLRKENLPALAISFLTGVSILALHGILQFLGINTIAVGIMKESAYNLFGSIFGWGVMIACGLAVASSLPHASLSKIQKIWVGISSAILILALFLLNFREIWLVLSAVVILGMAFRYSKSDWNFLPVGIAVISIFISAVSPILPALVEMPAEVRPSFLATWGVDKEVLSSWRAPLGMGPSNFPMAYNMHRPVEINLTPAWSVRFSQGFSFITSQLASVGILGTLAWILVIAVIIWQAWKLRKDGSVYPVLSAAAFLSVMLFIYPAFGVQVVFLAILLGVMVRLTSRRGEFDLASSSKNTLPAFAAVLILFGAVLSGSYLAFLKYAAAANFNLAGEMLNNNDLDGALLNYEKALSKNPSSDVYLRAVSQVYLMKGSSIFQDKNKEEKARNQEAQVYFATSVQLAKRAAEKIGPQDAINWANLGSVYEATAGFYGGDSVKFAKEAYSKSRELDRVNPVLPFNLARVSLLEEQSNKDEATRMLDESIRLKEDYLPARLLALELAIVGGDEKQIIEKTNAITGRFGGDVGVLSQVGVRFLQGNKPELGREIMEAAVSTAPNFSDGRFLLAQIYEKLNRKDDAIKQYEAIKELNKNSAEAVSAMDKAIEALRAPVKK